MPINNAYYCGPSRDLSGLSIEDSRNDVIKLALNSPEGRIALAQAMREPLKPALEYSGGRGIPLPRKIQGCVTIVKLGGNFRQIRQAHALVSHELSLSGRA